jgi:predicted transcriptional regulator
MSNLTDHESELLSLTAAVVAAHVSNNNVSIPGIPGLISSVHEALRGLAVPAIVEHPKQEPAVSIRASVKPDYLVCLEDGAKLKMLKRHLMVHFQMTPEQYRAKWGLPSDYPMVAPSYAAQRSALAKGMGLGRKPGTKSPRKPK